MPHPTSGNTERGFTLVEVLVSLAAMAIGFIILWGMHFASLRMQSSDRLRADALRVADAALEAQRGNTAANNSTIVCTKAAPCPFGEPPEKQYFSVSDGDRFSNCTVQINWMQSWQRRVTATVVWRERISLTGGGGAANQRSQSVQLSAIYITH